MPKEIERKFLINLDQLELPSQGIEIKQGYFPMSAGVKFAVRIRIKNDAAFLTVKGENFGATRSEYEYPIPIDEAIEMLENHCQKPYIEKTRYELSNGDHIWEIDIFHGENEGLLLAEIELSSEAEEFDVPGWVTDEVTDDPQYYNSNLLLKPYKKWGAT